MRILIVSLLLSLWSFKVFSQMVFPEPTQPNDSGFQRTYFISSLVVGVQFSDIFLPINSEIISVSRAGFPLLAQLPIYNHFAGVIPGPIPVPYPPLPSVATIPTYTTPGQTCICVPTGTCTGTIVTSSPNDGTGIIDIRIVNNVCLELLTIIQQTKKTISNKNWRIKVATFLFCFSQHQLHRLHHVSVVFSVVVFPGPISVAFGIRP